MYAIHLLTFSKEKNLPLLQAVGLALDSVGDETTDDTRESDTTDEEGVPDTDLCSLVPEREVQRNDGTETGFEDTDESPEGRAK